MSELAWQLTRLPDNQLHFLLWMRQLDNWQQILVCILNPSLNRDALAICLVNHNIHRAVTCEA